eukprot:Nk52_evm16s2474 gene=Nk52_evmTU16s2474
MQGCISEGGQGESEPQECSKEVNGSPHFEEPKLRICVLNDREANLRCGYEVNRISTGKYSLLTFLPKNLYEQFHRAANCYFLAMFILSMLPWTNAINPGTSAIPLTFVLSVSAIKDAIEDYQRHKSDTFINYSKTHVLRKCDYDNTKCRWCYPPGDRSGSGESLNSGCGKFIFSSLLWKDVEVGDIVEIRKDEFVPADVLLLTSSDEDGLCYIETANIDGESNLKVREAETNVHAMCSQRHTNEGVTQGRDHLEMYLCLLKGKIEYPPPNNNLLSFSGTLCLQSESQTAARYPLCMNNVLLRGCKLRNIDSAYGVVLYAGHDSKLMQNDTINRFKRTHIERLMNKQIVIVFFMLMGFCFAGALASNLWTGKNWNSIWYIDFPQTATLEGFINFFNFILILQSFVPISLYVSVEMVKVAQAYFISQDIDMYDGESDTPAKARTSALSEELGQINYIFSDKTGTLTQNKMEFSCCNIHGVTYGLDEFDEDEDDDASSDSKVQQSSDREEKSKTKPSQLCPYAIEGEGFHSSMLEYDLSSNSSRQEHCIEFFTCLSLCHTIIPEYPSHFTAEGKYLQDYKDKKGLIYQAQSPDEAALATAARNVGIAFHSRVQNRIAVNALGEEKIYELLHILEFSSERKRMSVIVKCPETSRIVLYCKGADEVILDRIKNPDSSDEEKIVMLEDSREALREFACLGLRTLCIAVKYIEEEEYARWSSAWEEAQVGSSHDAEKRQHELHHLAGMMETNMNLLGVTGIDDQLQEGVPQAIKSLKQAGIKLWVLTGDKQETAINIGFSAELLNENQNVIVINAASIEDTKGLLNKALEQYVCIEGVKEGSEEYEMNYERNALVINGSTLHFALQKELRLLFLSVATGCSSVICCRCSPLQKAMVVRLVGRYKDATSLAIGDGANDVSMIKEADVGVGISGQEGMQAVLASDYSIAQFRFLARLLLVHGRWSYKRITWAILYFFYKNYTFILVNFWFSFYSAFSAQTLYEFTYIMLFNVAFTALPPLVVAVFDQDVSAKASLLFPELYQENLSGNNFNSLIFWRNVTGSFYQSLVLFFIPMMSFSTLSDGKPLDMQGLGTTIYIIVVIVINGRLAIDVHNWTVLNFVTIVGSCAVLFAYMAVYHSILPDINLAYGVISHLLPEVAFWTLILLLTVMCLFPHWVLIYAQRQFYPTATHIVAEMEKYKLGPFHQLSKGVDTKPSRPNPMSASSRANSLSALSRTSIASQMSVVKLKAATNETKKEWYSGFAFSYPARISTKVWCKVRGFVQKKDKDCEGNRPQETVNEVGAQRESIEDLDIEIYNLDRLQPMIPTGSSQSLNHLSDSCSSPQKSPTKQKRSLADSFCQEDADEYFYADEDVWETQSSEDDFSHTVSSANRGTDMEINSTFSFSEVEPDSSPNTTLNCIEDSEAIKDST